MSSKLKRKRQAQRLARDLAVTTAAHQSCAATLRIKSQELASTTERLERTDAWMKARTDHYLRELARYKFIDDLIAEAIETLPLDHRAYIRGETRHVNSHWPYLEILQVPDMPVMTAENAARLNESVVQVLHAYAWRISEDECHHRIQLCYDGDKYMTYALPGVLAKMTPQQAMSVFRRELAPAFYRMYMDMVAREGNREGIVW